MVYVGLAILLGLVLWHWRQKAVVLLCVALFAFGGLFSWSIWQRHRDQGLLEKIPCAVVNAQAPKIMPGEQGQGVALEEREVSFAELLAHAVQEGLLAENVASNLKRMQEQKAFWQGPYLEYFLQGGYFSNSLFSYAEKQCQGQGEALILILNTSDENIGNEKISNSWYKHH